MIAQGPVLGIDPGSVATGFGIIEQDGNDGLNLIKAGVIRPPLKKTFSYRLKFLYDEILDLIEHFQPQVCAVEDVFVAKNAKAALKLGHARASVIMAAINSGLTIHEYSPLEIKKAVVGYGRAEKRQVQQMVSIILGLDHKLAKDASDAVAVALCHINSSRLSKLITLSL